MKTKPTREKTLKELKGLLLYKTNLLEQGLYWQLTEDLQYLLEKSCTQQVKNTDTLGMSKAKKDHIGEVNEMSYRKEFRFNFSAPLVDLCSKKDATMKDINDVLVKQMDYIEHLLDKEREGIIKEIESLPRHGFPKSDLKYFTEIEVLFTLKSKEKHE